LLKFDLIFLQNSDDGGLTRTKIKSIKTSCIVDRKYYTQNYKIWSVFGNWHMWIETQLAMPPHYAVTSCTSSKGRTKITARSPCILKGVCWLIYNFAIKKYFNTEAVFGTYCSRSCTNLWTTMCSGLITYSIILSKLNYKTGDIDPRNGRQSSTSSKNKNVITMSMPVIKIARSNIICHYVPLLQHQKLAPAVLLTP
jgi:hypothetical protein